MALALTVSPASEFQARYHSLSSFELESIALKQSVTLSPQALAALRKEMDRRGFSRSLRRGIEAQVTRWTQDDIATFIDQYRHRPCPRCGVQGKKLNGVDAAVARSFIVTSAIRTKLVISCSSCIKTELERPPSNHSGSDGGGFLGVRCTQCVRWLGTRRPKQRLRALNQHLNCGTTSQVTSARSPQHPFNLPYRLMI